MARLVAALLVLLVASAVLASDYYTKKQEIEIDKRIKACWTDVTKTNSEGTNPGYDCQFQADQFLAQGTALSSLPIMMCDCIQQLGGTLEQATTVKECLVKAFAEPLSS